MRALPFVKLLPQEEKELSRRWKTTSDQEARDRLIFSCTGYVRIIAKKRCHKNAQLYQELVQEGYLGLLHAVEKYNPNFKNRFATYALWWIRAYVARYLKQIPHDTSLDEPISEDADITFKDSIVDESFGQEQLLGLNTEGDVQLLQQVATTVLHGNEWEVIRLRYFSGDDVVTLEEVGHDVVGRRGQPITREAVRIIETRAIEKLRNGLRNWEHTLEEKRHAKERNTTLNYTHHTENVMGIIPEDVMLSCVEKLSTENKSVSAIEISNELNKEGNFFGTITPFLVGQNIKHLVKKGRLTKYRSGSGRTYKIKSGSSREVAHHARIATTKRPTPPPPKNTNEDQVFRIALTMVKLDEKFSAEAISLSIGLRELAAALQKIPHAYRERAIQAIRKDIDHK